MIQELIPLTELEIVKHLLNRVELSFFHPEQYTEREVFFLLTDLKEHMMQDKTVYPIEERVKPVHSSSPASKQPPSQPSHPRGRTSIRPALPLYGDSNLGTDHCAIGPLRFDQT